MKIGSPEETERKGILQCAEEYDHDRKADLMFTQYKEKTGLST